MKLTKTQIKLHKSLAWQGVADMTVILEKVEIGDINAVRQYAEAWLDIYAERLESANIELKMRESESA
jgi:hypothetical protein